MGRGVKLLILLAAFFVLTGSLVILAALPHLVTGTVINRHVDFEVVYHPREWGLEVKPLSLLTDDGYELAAWELEVQEPKAVVIFLGGLEHPPVSAFWGHARALAEHGFASLLIEMRSHGASAGEQVYLGYMEHYDLLAGIQYIQENLGDVPLVAFGADLGGVVAINGAGLYSELDGVISIGAFSSWPDLFRDNLYFSGTPLLVAMLEKPFVQLYTLVKFGWKNRGLYPQQQAANLAGRPALLMHSTDDPLVSVLNLERITLSLGPGAKVETWFREGDEHLVTKDFLYPENDSEYLQRVLGWLKNNFN
ncbi:MAG TPA: alpha/beta hydrolase [Firmicutes bacterium]|jgi:pimeloyl-ACP methyl ester carboxylesterase|nr:alpha/beta hydrolase [Bacillota bacterium]